MYALNRRNFVDDLILRRHKWGYLSTECYKEVSLEEELFTARCVTSVEGRCAGLV
jgi:hypothetical protein